MKTEWKLAPSDFCTGCGACVAICPSGAIEKRMDNKGFLVPFIRWDNCVGCGRCTSVCPITSPEELPRDILFAYAAKCTDESLRLKSSSGGIFSLLATQVLKRGGAVYGAGMDERLNVRHIRVTKHEELDKLRGSKYVESDIGNCLEGVRNDLALDIPVMFSGTPCQVAGLHAYMKANGSDMKNLLLCDIVCHGTPSPRVWEDYLKLLESERGAKVAWATFRDKEEGWHERMAVRYGTTGGDEKYTDRRFSELFLSDLALKESCHECRYTTPYRISDITLGDYWGIENSKYSHMDDDKGVSLLLIHTQKGVEALRDISSDCSMQQSLLMDATASQQALKSPFPRPENKDLFWKEYFDNGLLSACELYVDSKYAEYNTDTGIESDCKFIVLMPDGSGSKGDEALTRGVLNALRSDHVRLITPDMVRTWKEELIDICSSFDEISGALSRLEDKITRKGTLIVLGTDTLDGTCGLEDSFLRLNAIKKMADLGGRCLVFCSFRSDVHPDIIDKIKKLGEHVGWYLRDYTSLDNFEKQTGLKARYFPDFAYYCGIDRSEAVAATEEKLKLIKEANRTVVGLNFSQQSMNSFYLANTERNRREYIEDTIGTIRSAIPDAFFLLISHDRRSWESHWSDSEFAEAAGSLLNQNERLILPEDITYPELLSLLGNVDYLVSGRMHLSVASFRSGVIPIIYTGDGKEGRFSMVEKCRGMFLSRIGRDDLVASDRDSLVKCLDLVRDKREELTEKLRQFNANNAMEEGKLLNELREELEISDDTLVLPATGEEQIKYLRRYIRSLVKNMKASGDSTVSEKRCDDLQRQINDLVNWINNQQAQINGYDEYSTRIDDVIGQFKPRDERLDDQQRQINDIVLWNKNQAEQISGIELNLLEQVQRVFAELAIRDERQDDLQRQIVELAEWNRNQAKQISSMEDKCVQQDASISFLQVEVENLKEQQLKMKKEYIKLVDCLPKFFRNRLQK